MSHLAPLFLAIAISPAAQEQHTTVTPAWAKQNPGRFQFSMGSAFDGSNGVSLRLVSTGASSHFRVIARVWKKTKAGRKPVMGWDVPCAGARKSMFWQMSLWPDETREVEFTIFEFPTAGRKRHEYKIRLSDFVRASPDVEQVDFKAVRKEAKAAGWEFP